jgi:elongation factor 2
LKDLKDDFMKGAPIKISEPVVSFAESVSELTDMTIIAKSPNKHNRIYMTAEPLSQEVITAIDEGSITPEQEVKLRARCMADEYGWSVEEARKIWTFGCPPDAKANLLVDTTKAVQYLSEIRDSCVGAFIQATAAGIICDEVMRGCRFNLCDVTMHADAIHRGAGQMMPPTKRAMYACQIKSGPRICEPMFLADITVPSAALSGVYSTLNQRRGQVEGKEDRPGTPLCKIRAFLPVLESFGFTSLLRQNTGGQAFPQLIFSHWNMCNGSPYDEGSQANKIVTEVRKRKGLKEELPEFNDYYDKL